MVFSDPRIGLQQLGEVGLGSGALSGSLLGCVLLREVRVEGRVDVAHVLVIGLTNTKTN